jgi:glycosyltransferase involved in cell wall biosynthesis
MKILFLTTVLPARMRMGSEVASQLVIDTLRDLGHEVTVLGYVRSGEDYVNGTNEICVAHRNIETAGAGIRAIYWMASAFAEGLPYSIAKYKSHAYVSLVNELTTRNSYSIVIIDHAQMSWMPLPRSSTFKMIGLAHNVEHLMYKSFLESQTSFWRRALYRRETRLMQSTESAFANSVDHLWVLTADDAAYFRSVKAKGHVVEIPLPPTTSTPINTPPDKKYDIGLIGSWSWAANEQGLKWFIDSVYPALPATTNIAIAGSGADWLVGYSNNIKYLGFVKDSNQFLREARVLAIPTLSGGGIQIKTLEAIASGSQIVATPLALRGIADYPSTVNVASTASDFANSITQALALDSADQHLSEIGIWSDARRSQLRERISTSLHELN